MPSDPELRRTIMRSVVFFAIAALAIAGLMPKVMSNVGGAGAPQAEQARNAAPPVPQTTGNYRTVTVRSDAGGHFRVEGSVDGRRLDFMVDTGATMVALRERDAARLGIFPRPSDYTARTSTANGVIRVAPVRLSSLEVNGIRVFDVSAAVIPDEALSVNLLGMSFLGRVRRFEMANGRLVMEQ
jgi:aspartyl protease family protein